MTLNICTFGTFFVILKKKFFKSHDNRVLFLFCFLCWHWNNLKRTPSKLIITYKNISSIFFVTWFRKWSSPLERRWSQRKSVRGRSSVERSSANSWTDSCRTRPTTSGSETGLRFATTLAIMFFSGLNNLCWVICYVKVAWVIYVSSFCFLIRLTWTSSKLLPTSLYEHWWHQCVRLPSYVSMTNIACKCKGLHHPLSVSVSHHRHFAVAESICMVNCRYCIEL